MAVQIQCSDCGKIFSGKDEHEAEVKFNNHNCPSTEKYKSMSQKELRELILNNECT